MAVTYVFCGGLATAMFASEAARPRGAADWRASLIYAVAWLGGMVALYTCFGLVGAVWQHPAVVPWHPGDRDGRWPGPRRPSRPRNEGRPGDLLASHRRRRADDCRDRALHHRPRLTVAGVPTAGRDAPRCKPDRRPSLRPLTHRRARSSVRHRRRDRRLRRLAESQWGIASPRDPSADDDSRPRESAVASPSRPSDPVIAPRVPTPVEIAARPLQPQQVLPHKMVPNVEVVSLEMMEHLRRVVVIRERSECVGGERRAMRHQIVSSCLEIGLVLVPAEIQPGKKSGCGHRIARGPPLHGARARAAGAVGTSRDRVDEVFRPLQLFRGDAQACELGAPQGDNHPPGHRWVARQWA